MRYFTKKGKVNSLPVHAQCDDAADPKTNEMSLAYVTTISRATVNFKLKATAPKLDSRKTFAF